MEIDNDELPQDFDVLEPMAPDNGSELDRYSDLKQLLLGKERDELERLKARLDKLKLSAEELSQSLPQAIMLREQRDDQLSRALAPTIENSLEVSVKRNPGVLVDAIFPVIGPAIRKSIREALSSVVENINRSVENSFSAQGLRWRMEARRTGKSFAEVVLKHSLVFRVEQVFLIHRETALPLQHVIAPGIASGDPDLITSMLGAIQSFVADSFSSGDEQSSVDQVEFGDRVLLIARSPTAVIACVVRGMATSELRADLQETLELICSELSTEFRSFTGDDTPFLSVRGRMDSLLVEKKVEASRKSKGGLFLRAALLVTVTLAVASIYPVWAVSERYALIKWRGLQDDLENTPGIVITQATRDGSSYTIRGLRDPLAADPQDIVHSSKWEPEDLTLQFKPYISLEESMLLKRAQHRTNMPDGVTFDLDQGKLTARGKASREWTTEAEDICKRLPGIEVVDFSRVEDEN